MITINDSQLKLVRFKKVLLVREDEITVQFSHYQCIIKGKQLTITYLSSLEMWISGLFEQVVLLHESN